MEKKVVTLKSHPEWVRGLKLKKVGEFVKILLSHPEWVRGLKQEVQQLNGRLTDVAPRVGAWIETDGKDSKC